ncbi:ThiF family adenylyltransferase [Corynebacterium anserum]|uniref:ThiF family adenylyltransferase n=1 Tax=Corynebacterium anserum TaxID=2684406 RepID=A0A7G7YQG1_9CORY|nr:ThiF family adenylyltransferase [Corynebacterium anserum]MBC2682417.1 ThiF family adenylyltransferase [Corynebacterium anserum]QNH96731.1 ThiF family adenylyltransferase [Corynebacterium anserum]
MRQLELRRVARQLNLPGFGLEQQEALHNAHVLVVGAGGLGCPALQQMAAAGIGEITVIDDDTVDITNIHRQILFGADDVGKPKVEVAAERIRALQPGIRVHTLQERLTPDNALELVHGVDVVLDGSDSFSTKYLVADAAEATSTPLVWGTVLRFRGDVALWHSGVNTADARGVGLRDLFPEQPGGDFVPDCATAGVLGVTTSVIAGLMVTELIMYLTGLADTVGKVTSYDALGAQLRSLHVAADPQRALVTGVDNSYNNACAIPGRAGAGIADTSGMENAEKLLQEAHDLQRALQEGDAVGLDIREDHEVMVQPWPGVDAVLAPLSGIHRVDDVPPELFGEDVSQIVVACASGMRSQHFIERFGEEFQTRGITLRNLPGGIAGLV